MSDHYGNLDIYGYVTVGKNTSGSYRFPLEIGNNGEFMGIENGNVVFKRPGPTIYVSELSGGQELVDDVDFLITTITSITGQVDTFQELLDTPAPGEADLHEGEVIIVDPNASAQSQKISYSGVKLTDITTNGLQTLNSESSSGGNIDLVSDGTIDIIPNGNGTIQLSLYVPISTNLSITSVDILGGSTISANSVENGMTVTSVDLDWNSYNKTPTSQSLNQGIGAISVGTTSFTHVDSFTTNRTYTLSYSDGTSPDTDSSGITFRNLRFWGETSTGSNLTEADIEAGSSQLATSRSKTITFSPNGDRVFYAYPTSFGLASVTDTNGLSFQSWMNGGVESTSPYTISVTNDYGVTQDYYVYQSFNTFGASSITFTWS